MLRRRPFHIHGTWYWTFEHVSCFRTSWVWKKRSRMSPYPRAICASQCYNPSEGAQRRLWTATDIPLSADLTSPSSSDAEVERNCRSLCWQRGRISRKDIIFSQSRIRETSISEPEPNQTRVLASTRFDSTEAHAKAFRRPYHCREAWLASVGSTLTKPNIAINLWPNRWGTGQPSSGGADLGTDNVYALITNGSTCYAGAVFIYGNCTVKALFNIVRILVKRIVDQVPWPLGSAAHVRCLTSFPCDRSHWPRRPPVWNARASIVFRLRISRLLGVSFFSILRPSKRKRYVLFGASICWQYASMSFWRGELNLILNCDSFPSASRICMKSRDSSNIPRVSTHQWHFQSRVASPNIFWGLTYLDVDLLFDRLLVVSDRVIHRESGQNPWKKKHVMRQENSAHGGVRNQLIEPSAGTLEEKAAVPSSGTSWRIQMLRNFSEIPNRKGQIKPEDVMTKAEYVHKNGTEKLSTSAEETRPQW